MSDPLDLEVIRRATNALALELPAAVHAEYASLVFALCDEVEKLRDAGSGTYENKVHRVARSLMEFDGLDPTDAYEAGVYRRIVQFVIREWGPEGRAEIEQDLAQARQDVLLLRDALDRLDGPHVIEFGEDRWTLQHPLRCRDDLLSCDLNYRGEKPSQLGRFFLHDDGALDGAVAVLPGGGSQALAALRATAHYEQHRQESGAQEGEA